jgi:hypothetical protein
MRINSVPDRFIKLNLQRYENRLKDLGAVSEEVGEIITRLHNNLDEKGKPNE